MAPDHAIDYRAWELESEVGGTDLAAARQVHVVEVVNFL